MVLSVTQQLLAATCWSKERIDLIARGATSQMIHTSFDKSYGWQSPQWDSLGESFQAVAPTIVSWAPERLDTFGLGEITNELMHNAWDGTTTAVWQASWQELSGQTLNGPSIRFNGPFAVATWGPDRLDMFGVGTKDSAMYHQSVCYSRDVVRALAGLTAASGTAANGKPTGNLTAVSSRAI